ncbi:MAG: PAS domain S-box protein, partial [Anaerolineae bacterium]|nr:PAS domain S-box protein [Anaerolineae bacterium]
AFSNYAMVLSRLGAYEPSYAAGELVMAVMNQLGIEKTKVKASVMINGWVKHWHEPLRNTFPALVAGAQSGLENGDVEFFGYSIYLHGVYAFCSGEPLAEVERLIEEYHSALQRHTNITLDNQLMNLRRVMNRLMGREEDSQTLSETYKIQALIKAWIEGGDGTAPYLAYTLDGMLAYLQQDYPIARQNIEAAFPFVEGAVGMPYIVLNNFYHSLVLLAGLADVTEADQVQILAQIETNQTHLLGWAEQSPLNHQHKYRLIEAERARVAGDNWRAGELYDQAITQARENRYLQDEALACELAATFYFGHHKTDIGQTYLLKAYHAYLTWGAQLKVSQLKAAHPGLLATPAGQRDESRTISPTVTKSADSTTSERPGQLDLHTFTKASQAIAGEIRLDKLLETLMRITIENAGAQKGLLLLEEGGQFVIQAAGAVEQSGVEVLQSIPISQSSDLSPAIVNYVTRTRDSLVLSDASNDKQFRQDAYIQTHQPKSILCTPLINQGRVIAVVYLENNLTSGAFTQDRLAVLNLLSAQAAISIENARLYTTLAQSEDRYRTLFEDSRDTIFITTPTGQIVDINPAGLALFGRSREEMTAMNAEDFYTNPEDRARFQKEIEQYGQVRDFSINFQKKDGTPIDAVITATVRRGDDGRVVAYQGIIRDVTEQRRAEQERLRLS